MNTISLTQQNHSTLNEWASFFNVLHEKQDVGTSLLKRTESPARIMRSLEKEFSNIPQPAIFRRLGKHTQLVLQFS